MELFFIEILPNFICNKVKIIYKLYLKLKIKISVLVFFFNFKIFKINNFIHTK